jgi:hypothetical protein
MQKYNLQKKSSKRNQNPLRYYYNSIIIYINSLRPSVTEFGSITKGQSSSARHSQTPGFSPIEFVVGVSGWVRHRKLIGPGPARPGTPYDCDRVRRKKVLCTWWGRAAVTRVEVSRVSSVSCLFCFAPKGRGYLELGTMNNMDP